MKFIKDKNILLLRWWLFFMVMNLATVVLFLTGVVSAVDKVDFTKISFLIYIIFYIFSLRNGIFLYKFSKELVITDEDINKYHHSNEIGWFVSDILLTLGIFGTVIGFIYMLGTTFVSISSLNIVAIKSAILKMSTGMSTALYTTAAGLACSLLLKIQLFDFGHYLDKISKNYGRTEENEESKII